MTPPITKIVETIPIMERVRELKRQCDASISYYESGLPIIELNESEKVSQQGFDFILGNFGIKIL